MPEYRMCIQCIDATSGQTGTFIGEIVDNGRKAVSPVMRDLCELVPWMRKNDWQLQEYVRNEYPLTGHTLVPWRVVRG